MLESLIQHYGYWTVLIGTLLEGETILVLGGFAAHRAFLALPGVMLAGFVGSLTSDQIFFFVARRRGNAVLANRPHWKSRLERFQRLLDRYENLVILAFRFFYGFRVIGPFALGMSRVPAWRFVILNAIGAAIWATAVSVAGYMLGRAAEALIADLERYEFAAMAAIAVVGLSAWLLRSYCMHSRTGE